MTLPKTLDSCAAFRAGDEATPIVLMGYYNPDLFLWRAAFPGRRQGGRGRRADRGRLPRKRMMSCACRRWPQGGFHRLATPTTDDARLRRC